MIKQEILKEQVLFEGLDSADLKTIGGLMKRQTFKKKEHIFKEREDAKGIYLIHSGKVEISKVTPDGWRQTLALLPKGHFFGELSIIEHRHHEAGAVAIEDTELFLLTKEDFEIMEKENLLLAAKIMKKLVFILSRNLSRMNERFLNALISY